MRLVEVVEWFRPCDFSRMMSKGVSGDEAKKSWRGSWAPRQRWRDWGRHANIRVSYNESNLSTSAWEYAAPTTRLEPSRPAGFVTLLLGWPSRGGGLQKGEADL